MLPNQRTNTKNIKKISTNRYNYAECIAEILKINNESNHFVAKKLARRIGVCERTARNWLLGVRGPSGYDLILLIYYSKEVRNFIFEWIKALDS